MFAQPVEVKEFSSFVTGAYLPYGTQWVAITDLKNRTCERT